MGQELYALDSNIKYWTWRLNIIYLCLKMFPYIK